MNKQIVVLFLIFVSLCLTENFVWAEETPDSAVGVVEKAEVDGAEKYAFIAAVSDYDAITSLSCTVQDAQDFKERLLKLGFEEQNIVFLTSEESFTNAPTKKNIQSRYENLLERIEEGAWVVVYLSGHGVQIQGKEGSWFCPADTKAWNLEETTVSIDGMLKKLSESKAGFRWMIVDACRNVPGEEIKGLFKGQAGNVKSLETVSEPPKNVTLMQSCQPKHVSYELKEKQNGIFTLSLLEALSMEADRDENGIVTFSEIFQHASKRTNELANHHIGKPQIPQLTGKITDFNFLRDTNYPKADELLSEALKKADLGDFDTALGLAEQAYALCPRIRKFRKGKEKIELRKKTSEPKVQKEITWPSDDGLTLQEAYNKTAVGGTLTILRGIHQIPETLVVRKNITILGEGTNREYVVLKGKKENVLRVESGFAEIKNLTLKNVGDGKFLTTKEAEKETLEEKIERDLFNIYHSAVSVQSPMCAFENCVFTSEKGCGFAVNAKSADPILTACQAKNCGGAGFRISDGAKGKLTDCESSGNAQAGIYVQGTGTNPIVEKCRFTKGKSAGIFVLEGASGTFTDSESSRNDLAGIEVRDSKTNPTVEKCRFTEGKGSGIFVLKGAGGTFTDCESSGNALAEILVKGSGTNPMVEKCRFKESKESCGILVLEGASGTFTDCESSGNALAGIEVRDSGTNPTVEKCRFTEGKNPGILVSKGASGTFTNCESSGNANSGIEVRDSRTNPKVEGCQVLDNGWGIYVHDSAEGTFRNNTLSGNTNRAWIIETGSSPVREGNSPNW